MREMKDSGVAWIDNIPKDWAIIPLKMVAEYRKGLSITKADLSETGIPVVSYGQIHSKLNSGTHLSDNLIRFVSPSYLSSNPSSIGKYGDLLFADTSEDYEGIGNAVYLDTSECVFAGYHTIIVRPTIDMERKYLAYLCRSDCWRSQLRARAFGIKVYSVTQTMLKSVSILLPPTSEQQKIVSIHDAENNGLFDSVIVVTNRVVLDSQLQDTINSFEHQVGLVEAIDDKKNSRSLAEAINDKKRIIICTIQKFLFAKKDIEKFRGRKFAIIIDEAHQGQNGESAKSLRRSLIDIGVAVKEYAEEAGIEEEEVDLTDEYINAVIGQGRHDNQSFFAFTATPKAQTLESFGTVVGTTPEGELIKAPFHVYSMRQAIEEGYILDVLANYTTVKEAFKLIRVSEDNPELIEGQASRALFKYYKQHGYTIAQKTEMIMTNFLENCRYQINGKGKAMVVADSRANAVRYYLAIKKYLTDHAEQCVGSDVMIAFSGEVTLDDYPSEKPFTEATMNLDENGKYITTDKKFRKVFHSSQYNILVVANKYQTGFDEPLLHTMYVDKKLRDVTAVQTLSRLNRTTFGKNSTFVLDFENTEEDIKGAFLPYYETTMLEGITDLNRVYDLRNKIRDFMLYNFEDVETFNKFMAAQTDKNQDAAALGRLAGMFRPVIARYMDLSEDDRYTLRDYVRKFNKAYAFVTQLVRLHDRDLFNEYQYTLHLIKLLPKTSGDEFVDIEDKIKLEYASLTETFRGAIVLNEKPPAFVPGGSTAPKVLNKKKDTLQSIIDKVNERFSGNFTDADRVIIEGIYQMFMKDSEVKKFRKYAKDNSTEMFVRSLFPDKFRDIVTQCFLDNNDSFAKLFNDPDFYQKVQDAMAAELYKALRKE